MSLRSPLRLEITGALLVVLASCAFGGVVVLGKVAADFGLAVPPLVATYMAVATITLGIPYLVRSRARMGPTMKIWCLLFLGGIGLAVNTGLFYFALKFGTVSTVTILFFTHPVMVALLSYALGRSAPGRLLVTALAVSVLGTVLVVGGAQPIDISGVGVLLAMGAAAAYSGYVLGAEVALRHVSPMATAIAGTAVSAVVMTVLALIARSPLPTDGQEWMTIVSMGLLNAVALLLLFLGLRRIGAVRTTVVGTTEPVAAAVLAVILLDETIGIGMIVGGGCILAAAAAATVARLSSGSAMDSRNPPVHASTRTGSGSCWET